MKKIVTAVVLAAVSAAASWAVRRVLDRSPRAKPRRQIETWENEGGALAPQSAAVRSSQVPR